MSIRRSPPLLPGSRDGTSQRSRQLPALDPAHARIDERTSADLLAFVQAYAREQLNYFEPDPQSGKARPSGTWSALAESEKVTTAEILAYLADPARLGEEAKRWLGRPHFALLLTFVELLRHPREHLNDFTRRHLDYYYRELLALAAKPAVPDRATVILGLGPAAREARVPAGTPLLAGRDPGNVARVYRTEREILVNRASVASLRSVFVDRRIIGIPDVRRDASLTAPEALYGTLRIALGSPKPGDEVPRFKKLAVDFAFLKSLTLPPEDPGAALLDFAWKKLYLKHYELAELMRLYRRRRDADAEWAEINALLGVTSPLRPRAFLENLESRVGKLDFAEDELPQVKTVDDLYIYRADETDFDDDKKPDVRAYLDKILGGATPPIAFEDFEKAMQKKLLIDAEWRQINRLLERIARRRLRLLEWRLPELDPNVEPDFDANLRAAVGKWPPPWPWKTTGIDTYELLLAELAGHLFMPIERVETLSTFAHEVDGDPASDNHEWGEIDRILADAHRDMVYAGRRTQVDAARKGRTDAAALVAVMNFVLGQPDPPLAWDSASAALAEHMDAAQFTLLVRFHDALTAGTPIVGFGWPDAIRALELAWRRVQAFADPVARKIAVHNIYAHEDATTVRDAVSPGWRTFGRRPLQVNEREPQGATLGWTLRSPTLSLSEGTRTITLTLGLKKDGFDPPSFVKALRWDTDTTDPTLVTALGRAIAIQVSTEKGWITLPLASARLATGVTGDDYWSIRGVPRPIPEDRPALQLGVVVGASTDALAPLKGESQTWPGLRIALVPRLVRQDGKPLEWRAPIETFEPLVLSAVHLKVRVEGLSSLRLQHDDRTLDPKKPIEPFGSRPVVGTRMYVDHPELVRARLEELHFKIEWMGLPTNLKDHYINYGINSATEFKTQLALMDRNVEAPLGTAPVSLFEVEKDGGGNETKTKPEQTLAIADVGAAIKTKLPLFEYTSRNDLRPDEDIRQASRYLRWELTPIDFGHGTYPGLAAEKARLLALATSGNTKLPDTDAYKYRVNPPYTPTMKSLSVTYSTSIELDPAAPQTDHLILHVHPFGISPIDAELPSLLPRYPTAGELYIGVRDLRPPQHLTLLAQLAEGTSDPDIEPATPVWSYLAGERFVPLTGGVVHDTTRGLINAGIVELALPPAKSTGRLPPDLYWLRVAIPRSPRAVCDVVEIRAQAVSVLFDDQGNDPKHYQQPLPAGTIARLVDPDSRITSIQQPYTSYGGKPAEEPGVFNTRVSERLRHKQRALTAWDYERLVLQRFRQIYKAKALSTPGGGVDVIVIPDIRELTPADTFAPKAPANILADVQAYLAERAPAAARVQVRNARYIPVRVRLGVRFRKGIDEGFAQKRLNEDLVRFLSPWAFDEGAELMIGGRIYANSIVDFVDRREYVDYVAGIKLFRCLDGENFKLVPPVKENGVTLHYVPTDRPDQVLVAAPQHDFDIIPEAGYEQANFTGINYMRIELDFIVG